MPTIPTMVIHVLNIDVGLHLLGFDQHLLGVVLVFAGIASIAIVGLASVAISRRRSWPYLLVTLALTTLLVRTAFGMLSLGDLLSSTTHHILEHSLDVLAVGLLVGAVYLARSVDPRGEDTLE